MYLIIANSLDLDANGMTKRDEQVWGGRQAEYAGPRRFGSGGCIAQG
jgi:hypothetical protein